MTGEFSIAVHAIVFLNSHPGRYNSEILARNVCTNPARIRKVMSKLKRAGLIEAKEGAVGGYSFVLDARKTTLLFVFDAINEPVVTTSWRSGDPEMECAVASGMANVMDAIYSEMDECCRNRLNSITIYDVTNWLQKPEEAQEGPFAASRSGNDY